MGSRLDVKVNMKMVKYKMICDRWILKLHLSTWHLPALHNCFDVLFDTARGYCSICWPSRSNKNTQMCIKYELVSEIYETSYFHIIFTFPGIMKRIVFRMLFIFISHFNFIFSRPPYSMAGPLQAYKWHKGAQQPHWVSSSPTSDQVLDRKKLQKNTS